MYGYFICNVQSKVIRKKCYIHKKKQKNVIDRTEKKEKNTFVNCWIVIGI